MILEATKAVFRLLRENNAMHSKAVARAGRRDSGPNPLELATGGANGFLVAGKSGCAF